jgi:hypothetical protein
VLGGDAPTGELRCEALLLMPSGGAISRFTMTALSVLESMLILSRTCPDKQNPMPAKIAYGIKEPFSLGVVYE